ncbi:MAG: phage holin family protein [Tissierellia bacterium]|nr:phage holin family protein [Tissierellia bacterium]
MNTNLKNIVLRVVYAMIAIALVAFLTPGISARGGLKTYLFAGLAVGIIHSVLTDMLDIRDSATKRGCSGCLISALVLYLTGMIVSGFRVTIFGALIGSVVIGIVEMILPKSLLK